MNEEMKNDDTRPPIAAELRRKILVEAGHRCAIPACRYIQTEIHHIVPWATCKEHKYENLIALCPNCHQRADANEIDRKALRLYKGNLQFAHDKFSNLEVDFLFELKKLGPGGQIKWPPFNVIMLKRVLDAEYIQVHENTGSVTIGGMQFVPVAIVLSKKGFEFIDSLGILEL